eukprot:g810.t1
MLAFGGQLVEDPEFALKAAEKRKRDAERRLDKLRGEEIELMKKLEHARRKVRDEIDHNLPFLSQADRTMLRGKIRGRRCADDQGKRQQQRGKTAGGRRLRKGSKERSLPPTPPSSVSKRKERKRFRSAMNSGGGSSIGNSGSSRSDAQHLRSTRRSHQDREETAGNRKTKVIAAFDLLPVLATTGENAFEVGLNTSSSFFSSSATTSMRGEDNRRDNERGGRKRYYRGAGRTDNDDDVGASSVRIKQESEQQHMLPLFRLPSITPESKFIRHLPTKREVRRLRRVADHHRIVAETFEKRRLHALMQKTKRTMNDDDVTIMEKGQEQHDHVAGVLATKGNGARDWEREYPEFGLFSAIVPSKGLVGEALKTSLWHTTGRGRGGEEDVTTREHENDLDASTELQTVAERRGLRVESDLSFGHVNLTLPFSDSTVGEVTSPDDVDGDQKASRFAKTSATTARMLGSEKRNDDAAADYMKHSSNPSSSSSPTNGRLERKRQLRTELGESIRTIRELSTKVETEMLWVKQHCPVTSLRARNFVRRWGRAKLRVIVGRLLERKLEIGFKLWRRNARALVERARQAAFARVSGASIAFEFVKKFRAKRISRAFVKWKTDVAYESRMELLATQVEYTIAVQRAFRGWRCRRAYKNFKMALERAKRDEAATTIQCLVRGRQSRRRTSTLFQTIYERRAAMKIQSACRRRLGRLKMLDLRALRERNAAALRIQSGARALFAKRRTRDVLNARARGAAAIRLQSVARGRHGRVEALRRRTVRNKTRAAKCIQRRVRGVRGRHAAAIERAKHALYMKRLEKAAKKLQCAFRGHRGRLLYHLQKNQLVRRRKELHERARSIQNAWRAYRAQQTIGMMKRSNFIGMVVDARSWIEYYDEREGRPFFFNAITGDSSWEPPTRGYTRPDGKLVLFTGEIIDDPADVKNAMDEEEEGVTTTGGGHHLEHDAAYDGLYDNDYAEGGDDAAVDPAAAGGDGEFAGGTPEVGEAATEEAEPMLSVEAGGASAASSALETGGYYQEDAYTIGEGEDASAEYYDYYGEAGEAAPSGDYDTSYQAYEEEEGSGWTGVGAWVQYTDEESGAPYWYNHDTGETSWDDPSTAAVAVEATKETGEFEIDWGASVGGRGKTNGAAG